MSVFAYFKAYLDCCDQVGIRYRTVPLEMLKVGVRVLYELKVNMNLENMHVSKRFAYGVIIEDTA